MQIDEFDRSPARDGLAADWLADGADDPRRVLVARDGSVRLGALRGAFTAAGFRILDVRADAAALDDVAPALIDAARAGAPGQRVEARLDEAARARLQPALARTGAELVLDQIVYERELTAHDFARDRAPVRWRRYADVGRARLAALLARIFSGGPSGRAGDDALAELDELIFDGSGGGALDDSLWRIAEVDGAFAGVALAQRDHPAPGEGTLLYLGVIPELRGGGLGRALHADALAELGAAGVRRYRDATMAGQPAMQKIFARHGCRAAGTSHLYVVQRPVERGELDGAAALARHLDAAGYRVERAAEPGWLRAPFGFGRERALVEIGWLDDARLVQLVHRFALRVPRALGGRVARAIAALNASLNLPGFVFDERAAALSFRLALHLDEAGGLSVYRLRRALATVVRAVERHHAELLALVTAHAAPSLLERVPARLR